MPQVFQGVVVDDVRHEPAQIPGAYEASEPRLQFLLRVVVDSGVVEGIDHQIEEYDTRAALWKAGDDVEVRTGGLEIRQIQRRERR